MPVPHRTCLGLSKIKSAASHLDDSRANKPTFRRTICWAHSALLPRPRTTRSHATANLPRRCSTRQACPYPAHSSGWRRRPHREATTARAAPRVHQKNRLDFTLRQKTSPIRPLKEWDACAQARERAVPTPCAAQQRSGLVRACSHRPSNFLMPPALLLVVKPPVHLRAAFSSKEQKKAEAE